MLNEELETLVMASIETLKCSNKRCGTDEVFKLVNNSLEKEISREIFESLLYRLTEKQSVKLNILQKELACHCQRNPSSIKNAIRLLVLEAKKIKNTTAIL